MARYDDLPAFPQAVSVGPSGVYDSSWGGGGMSLRTYAAIKLHVPDSGIDWLDAMIRQSLRDSFAGQALISLIAKHGALDSATNGAARDVPAGVSRGAYVYADAMLAERAQRKTSE